MRASSRVCIPARPVCSSIDIERIVTPRTSGIGWTVNLYQLKQRSPLAFYALAVVFVGGMAHWVWKFFTSDD